MTDHEKQPPSATKKLLKNGKWKDVFLMAILALTLILAVWKIFYTDKEETITTSTMTENEQKVSRILAQIQGVGEAEVMICETEEGVQSVVVVCEGAQSLQVVMDVREAVAAALGTEQKSIKVYLKKE